MRMAILAQCLSEATIEVIDEDFRNDANLLQQTTSGSNSDRSS